MNDTYALLEILLVNGLAVSTPGPALLLVTHASVKESKLSGFLTALGVSVAAGFWAFTAVFGTTVLLRNSIILNYTIKIIGSCYLIWLGISAYKTAKIHKEPENRADVNNYSAFGRGLLLSLVNPKIVIFFGTIFVVLIPTSAPHRVDLIAVFVVVIEDICWYIIIIALFSSPFVRNRYVNIGSTVERVMGLTFIAFGVRILVLLIG